MDDSYIPGIPSGCFTVQSLFSPAIVAYITMGRPGVNLVKFQELPKTCELIGFLRLGSVLTAPVLASLQESIFQLERHQRKSLCNKLLCPSCVARLTLFQVSILALALLQLREQNQSREALLLCPTCQMHTALRLQTFPSCQGPTVEPGDALLNPKEPAFLCDSNICNTFPASQNPPLQIPPVSLLVYT